jgi:hypothetical protein
LEEKAMAQSIACPNCRFQIEVSDALSTQLREQLLSEFATEARRKENEFVMREEGLRLRQQELEASQQSMEQEIATRVAQEQARLAEEARKQAQESVKLEMGDLQDQLADAKEKITQAHQAELQLRKERRELEDQQRELELTVNRTLDAERAKVREDAMRAAAEENRLHLADKDKLITDLRDQIDDLRRISEQGTAQSRGEAMEILLEDLLRDVFPHDTIEPVPASFPGGDVLQHVHDPAGLDCGTILWESKRTKNWNEGWLPKLRNDQRAAKAHLAVLATVEMPKGLTTFGSIDGIWVTSRHCLVGLATALRYGLIEAARTKRSQEGRKTKIEVLYNYLAGSEFRQRIEGIVEAFITMKEDLESEKRSLHRLWAKREKQLERAALSTAGLYGDLGGILGASLPQIAHLELTNIAADPEVPDMEPVTVAIDDSPF